MMAAEDDEVCGVCFNGDVEDGNDIVFCESCNLAVHQVCYGVREVPKDDWFCQKCQRSPDAAVECVLCPEPNGAFKQTTDGRWCHLTCALYHDESWIDGDGKMEPICDVDVIPQTRFKLTCKLCKIKGGACIQCAGKRCSFPFHPLCIYKFGLAHNAVDVKSGDGDVVYKMQGFCPRHRKECTAFEIPLLLPKALPSESKEEETEPNDIVPEEKAEPVRPPSKVVPSSSSVKCWVCFNGDSQDINAILRCSECSVAVHQRCYGVLEVPQEAADLTAFKTAWKCKRCTYEAENPHAELVRCAVCPCPDGPYKRTDDERWAHVTCAIWLPEAFIKVPSKMEPICGLQLIAKARWDLLCIFCRNPNGACIQCSHTDCSISFHALCAFQNGVRLQVEPYTVPPEFEDDEVKESVPSENGPNESEKDIKIDKKPDIVEMNGVNESKSEVSMADDSKKNGEQAISSSKDTLENGHLQTQIAFLSYCRKHTNDKFVPLTYVRDRKASMERQKEEVDVRVHQFRLAESTNVSMKNSKNRRRSRAQDPSTIEKVEAISSLWNNVQSFFAPLTQFDVDRLRPFDSKDDSSLMLPREGIPVLDNALEQFHCQAQFCQPKDFPADPSTSMGFPAVPGYTHSNAVRLSLGLPCSHVPPQRDLGRPYTAEKLLRTSGGCVCSVCLRSSEKTILKRAEEAAQRIHSGMHDAGSVKQHKVLDRVPCVFRDTDGPPALNIIFQGKETDFLCEFYTEADTFRQSPRSTHSASSTGGEATTQLKLLNFRGLVDESIDTHGDIETEIANLQAELRHQIKENNQNRANLLKLLDGEELADAIGVQRQTYRDVECLSLHISRWHNLRHSMNRGIVDWPDNQPAIKEMLEFEIMNSADKNEKLKLKDSEEKGSENEAKSASPNGLKMSCDESKTGDKNDVAKPESADSTKDLSKEASPSSIPNSTATICFVCFDSADLDTNPLRTCYNCNVAVHKDCYGIGRVIHDANWICEKCFPFVRPAKLRGSSAKATGSRYRPQCRLCPIKGGALKATSDGDFVHVFCTIWHPDVIISDIVKMGPMLNVNAVLKRQKELGTECSLCKSKSGGHRRCSAADCAVWFHPLCAWYGGAHLRVDLNVDQCCADLRAFCEEHTPKEVDGKERELDAIIRIRSVTLSREIESFDEMKLRRARNQIPAQQRDSQDMYEIGACAVCFENWMDPASAYSPTGNLIIRCNVCRLDVHQACYGVIDLPAVRALWVCSRCDPKSGLYEKNPNGPSSITSLVTGDGQVAPPPITCCLCPRRGGAFKPTDDGRWAHVACAVWIPEVSFGNQRLMQPVTQVGSVLPQRSHLRCYLCKRGGGACIQCSATCVEPFHPICGLFAGNFMKIRPTSAGVMLLAFCKDHTPPPEINVPVPESYTTLARLRLDLDRARTLMDLIRKRERVKRGSLRAAFAVFEKTRAEVEEMRRRGKIVHVRKRGRADRQLPPLRANAASLGPPPGPTEVTKRRRTSADSKSGSVEAAPPAKKAKIADGAEGSGEGGSKLPTDDTGAAMLISASSEHSWPSQPKNVTVSGLRNAKTETQIASRGIRQTTLVNTKFVELPSSSSTIQKTQKTEADTDVVMTDIISTRSTKPTVTLSASSQSSAPRVTVPGLPATNFPKPQSSAAKHTQSSTSTPQPIIKLSRLSASSQVPTALYQNYQLTRIKDVQKARTSPTTRNALQLAKPVVTPPNAIQCPIKANGEPGIAQSPRSIRKRKGVEKPTSSHVKQPPKKPKGRLKSKLKSKSKPLPFPPKSMFRLNQAVINLADNSYKCIVKDARFAEDGTSIEYRVHYEGWKDSFDEWVLQDLIAADREAAMNNT
eukprot:175596_1